MIKKLNNKDTDTAKKIHAVFQAAYKIEGKWLGVSDFPPLKRTLESYMQGETEFFALFKEKEIAAIIEVETNSEETDIHSLVVLPKFFRQGLASQLLQFVYDRFETESFTVETGFKNVAAKRLYQQFGFIEEAQWDLNPEIRKIKYRLTLKERFNFNSERLLVRHINHYDKDLASDDSFAKNIVQILSKNVTKELPEAWQNISNIALAKSWIKDRIEESHFLILQKKSSLEIVGFLFLYSEKLEDKLLELRLGYLFSENNWGIGFATELLKKLIEHCKTLGNIKAISGGVAKSNMPSIKVLEKAGFTASNETQSSEETLFYRYNFDIS